VGVFSPGGSVPFSGTVSTSGDKSVRHVANYTLGLAGVESVISVPIGAVAFYLVERTRTARLQVADTTGLSGTTYEVLWPGCSLMEEGLSGTSTTDLYIQSNKDSSIVELVWWT
jgi:hypothetical protein